MSDAGASTLTFADIERFVEPELEEKHAGRLEPYLAAAAVLAGFDPTRLHPAGARPAATPSDVVLNALIPHCEPITQGPERGLWSLALPERRAALAGLGTRTAMRSALKANSTRLRTPVQRMFERVVAIARVDLRSLSRDELAALFTVLEWTDGILDRLPDRAEIQRTLTRVDLLAPMRRLADQTFVNRVGELAQLKAYVLGPPPPAPLFVFGPGGVGKSTLMSRFILHTVEPSDAPFAYIDIDRPAIRPDRPLTLLLDAVDQLKSQVKAPAAEVESLIKEIGFATRRAEPGRSFESASEFGWLFNQFNSVSNGPLDDGFALLVVDTFEEAQFLGSDVVYPLVQFLVEFAQSSPKMRVILSGRALPEEFLSIAFPGVHLPPVEAAPDEPSPLDAIPLPFRPMNLGVLDEDSARMLLRRSVKAADLPPLRRADLDDVIGIVSRNPMCLRLAARLLKDEGVEKLRTARSEFLTRLRAEKIQALLYGRILRRIGDDDVRKVAYPGLIVRRITPEVIRDVLAAPCDLDLGGNHNEFTIFEALAREAALVDYDPVDGSLHHRVDVRRAMLEDLKDQVDEDVIHAIDTAAVRFYSDQPGPVSRAEEIYHRLRLRESDAILERRWMPEAADRLKNAGDELMAQQRIWLAEKLGVTLDPSVRATATQEAWEDQATRSANRFLESQAPEKALEVLDERKERLPRSPLFAIEAEAYRFLGRFDDALKVARRGVDSASRAGSIDLALELLLKMVVIEEGREHLDAADAILDEAQAVAPNSSNELLRLRVKTTTLRLQRQLRPDDRDERATLRADALASLTDDMVARLRDYPVQLREAAAELAKDHAGLAGTAIETLGLEVATDAQASALGRAIETINAAQPDEDEADPELAAGVEEWSQAANDPKVIRKWATEKLSSSATRRLGGTVSKTEPGTPALRNVRNYFREGVSNSLKGTTGSEY